MNIKKLRLHYWAVYWIAAFLTGLLIVPSFAADSNKPINNKKVDDVTVQSSKYNQDDVIESNSYLLDDIRVKLNTCIQEDAGVIYPAYGKHSLLTLIDKTHNVEAIYGPSDLVLLTVPEYPVNRNMYLSGTTLSDLKSMINDAKAHGHSLFIKSAWRLPNTQQYLYNMWVSRVGLQRGQNYAAKPGHSEHQLGTTIDIGVRSGSFSGSKADYWLRDNAYKYGFVMSYPQNATIITGYAFEPWHYRYVGIEVATEIKNTNITLTEYLYDYYGICR